MTAVQLAREFATRSVARGGGDGALLLPAADALELVRRARDARIPVLGVGGFRVGRGDAARPDPTQTLDFAGASCRTNPWAEADSFLEDQLGGSLHFEVVLGESPEG